MLRRVVESTPTRTRVLTGYAGWGPGQLDTEMAASAWLTVDVDNLFRSMRAAFVVRAPGGVGSAGATRLFGMDAELSLTDTHPEPVVRSDWVPYQNPFLVDRVQGKDTTVEWAHLRLEEYLAVHPVAGFELRPEQEDRLYVQVEAAASLDVPNVSLVEYKAPPNYPAAQCPLCAADVPITAF